MSRATPRGFTLVELLVVILIIGMLAGLLVPAVVTARARARQTQCLNNQHEIAVAIQQYENAQGELPGYVNRFPASVSGGQPFSWPIILLQHIGRNDLWERWRDRSVPFADKIDPQSNRFLGVMLDVMVCPANTEAGPGALSYVANCGIRDGESSERLEYNSTDESWEPYDPAQTIPDSASHGVFLNRFSTPLPDPVRTEEIPDGARSTIMLSENLQAGYWYDRNELWVGIIWDWRDDDTWEYTPPPPCWTINSCLDGESRPDPPENRLARPSSNHAGGVNVTYCDGHSEFLSEDIAYNVYISLMTPDNATAKGPPDAFPE